MVRFVITVTIIILLVMGGLVMVTVFGNRDNLSRQVDTYDSTAE